MGASDVNSFSEVICLFSIVVRENRLDERAFPLLSSSCLMDATISMPCNVTLSPYSSLVGDKSVSSVIIRYCTFLSFLVFFVKFLLFCFFIAKESLKASRSCNEMRRYYIFLCKKQNLVLKCVNCNRFSTFCKQFARLYCSILYS